MPKLTIECLDPDDMDAIREAVQEAAGRCNIIFAKTAQALVDGGKARSERAAARQIAAETDEPVETVKKRIYRGKKELGTVVPKPKKPDADHDAEVGSLEPKGRNPEQEPSRKWASSNPHFASIAISQLERIREDDPDANSAIEALESVIAWAQDRIASIKAKRRKR